MQVPTQEARTVKRDGRERADSAVVFLLLTSTGLDVLGNLPHGVFGQVVFEVVEEVNDLLVAFE